MARLWILAATAGLLLAALAGCGGGAALSPEAQTQPQVLAEALASSDAATRLAAVEALGKLGDPSSVPKLAPLLEDEDSGVREAVIEALGEIGDPAAVPPLVRFLDGTAGATLGISAGERGRAARALGEIGDPAAVVPLARYATVSYDVARSALVAIGKPGARALIDALRLKNPTRRQVAADALGRIGDPRAVQALLAYASRGTEERDVAATALARIGRPAVKPLAAGLRSALARDDVWGGAAAAVALGRIGDPRAVPALTEAMNADVSAAVWNEASDAIARIYRKDVPKLLGMLGAQGTVRVYWGLIGLGKGSTVDELVSALGRYGSESMAEDYLNCGSAPLESAARRWAESHGYTVFTIPGAGANTWGQKA